MLVVDGIPVIDKSKQEKLVAKICKEFSRKGVPIKPEDIFLPWDDAKGKSQG
jgi:translation initiation factor 3 subunit B